jgi:hypothetical protein
LAEADAHSGASVASRAAFRHIFAISATLVSHSICFPRDCLSLIHD